MSTVTFTRLIEAPAEELWRVFTALPSRPDWLCTVDAVSVLTPGPFGVGTGWRESRTLPDGTSLVEEYLVIEATPPTRLTLISAGAGANYRTTYTFTPERTAGRPDGRGPANPATTVQVIQEGVPTGAYGRLLALVLGGLAARAVEGALRRDLADLAAVATRGRGPTATAA